MIETGVASPRAHGQAITRTETKMVVAKERSAPLMYQALAKINAKTITVGTKTADTRSAILAIGAFSDWADSTIRTIVPRVDSPPIRETFMRSAVEPLSVPPISFSPSFFSTGMLSPVIIDSSMYAFAPSKVPSAGRLSWAFTSSSSEGSISTISITCGSPSMMRVALSGRSFVSESSADPAFRLAPSSMSLPISTRVRIAAEASK